MRRNKQGSLSKCIVIWKASTFTLTGFLVGVTTVLSAGATTVLAQQGHGQGNSFDVIPGKLIYRNSDSTGIEGHVKFIQNSDSNLEERRQLHLGHHHGHEAGRHYNKANARRIHFRKRKFDNEKNARRQGQQCPGVCRYIPDRDFCPTNIVEVEAEESEAYDEDEEYDEDYYSDEEEEEYSDEYYYDEDEEKEEKKEKNKKNKVKNNRKGKARLTEGRHQNGEIEERNNGNRTSQGKKMERYGLPAVGNSENNLHVVYPLLTRFAASRGVELGNKQGNNKQRFKVKGVREGKMSKMSDKRRKRRRRPQVKRTQPNMRSAALEQEILIRWDHVVERGPFIGGDILVPPGVSLRQPNFRFLRKQWPNGEIPFIMDPSLNSCRQNAIFDAMDEIEEKTCIRFVDREDERNYIDVRRAVIGCSSYVGMVGGAQHLNLSTGCFSKFTVTHELIHAIGFDHEQSRKDRDKFIEVDFDNVLNEKEGQFELNPTFTGSGFPYDIRSIMHYSAFLFAKDKCEPTIYPINDKVDICEMGMGNGKGGMTDCDAAKINKMYKCTGKKYPKKCKVKKL